jgi:hypothetical protein
MISIMISLWAMLAGFMNYSMAIPGHLHPPVCAGFLDNNADSLSIQYVELSAHRILFPEIKKYIREQNDSCLLFRQGFGFLILYNVRLDRDGLPVPAGEIETHKKDVLAEFRIGVSSLYPHQKLGTPALFSFVEGRLVLIFNRQMEWIHGNRYSVASERKLKKMIAHTLTMEFDSGFIFKHLAGHPFVLSSSQRQELSEEEILELGSFTLGKSKTVRKHFDGSTSYGY